MLKHHYYLFADTQDNITSGEKSTFHYHYYLVISAFHSSIQCLSSENWISAWQQSVPRAQLNGSQSCCYKNIGSVSYINYCLMLCRAYVICRTL